MVSRMHSEVTDGMNSVPIQLNQLLFFVLIQTVTLI